MPSGVETTYHIAIDHHCGNEDLQFRIVTFASGCFFPDEYAFETTVFNSNQIYGHPAAGGVIGTAAVSYQEIESGGSQQGNPDVIDVEPFSSLGGPVPIYFNADGTPLPNGPILRNSPVLAAPDGVNTSFFSPSFDVDDDGIPNFLGTSAAAPHAAAVAALMLEAKPSLPNEDILSILQQTSRDIEGAGPDFRSGSGLIDAFAALEASLADPSPSVTPTGTSTPQTPPTLSPTATATLSLTPGTPCVGDCDGDGRIGIGELIQAVRIALDRSPLSTCAAADPDNSGTVTIGELIQAVAAALGTCPNRRTREDPPFSWHSQPMGAPSTFSIKRPFTPRLMAPRNEFRVHSNLVPDAHVAALLIEHDVPVIYTRDSDFPTFESSAASQRVTHSPKKRCMPIQEVNPDSIRQPFSAAATA